MINSTISRDQENFNTLKDSFQQLLFLVRNPNNIQKAPPQSVKQHLNSLLVLLKLKYLLTFGWIIISSPVIFTFQSSSESPIVTDYSVLGLLIVTVVLAPLLEETIYRLPLVFKPIYLGLGAGLAIYVLLSYYLLEISIWNLKHLIGYRIIGVITVMALTYWAAKKSPPLSAKTKTRIFPFLFYISALAFGFAHFEGLEDYNFSYFLVMFVPYFLSGIIYAIVRIRNGFLYAVILHSINNFIAAIISILIENLSEISFFL